MEFLSYRNTLPRSVWPKSPPQLTEKQQAAKEEYMKLWHEELPKKYQIIEDFNHGYIASLPLKEGIKTLEIGAGLGSHLRYEDLNKQEYYCLEYREEFCKEIRKLLPIAQIKCGDIQSPTSWNAEKYYGSFDRILAIHVLATVS